MYLKPSVLLIIFVVMFSSCRSSPQANIEIISENKATPIPPSTATPKIDYETNPKLQIQANSYLKLFDNMPQVPVYIKDEPIIKTGSETQKGVGYTLCESNNQPVIYLKKVFYQKANEKQLTNILKHELTHAYFCRQGIQAAHDERWRKKFREVGGFGN